VVPFDRKVKAYLIVVTDRHTNAIVSALTWSSPEWEQSRCYAYFRASVCWELSADSYQQASDQLREEIAKPENRYHYLHEHLDREFDLLRPADYVRPKRVKTLAEIGVEITNLLMELETNPAPSDEKLATLDGIRDDLDMAYDNTTIAAEEASHG